jgi:glycosyltransferase involved in cell wall biosynthesis
MAGIEVSVVIPTRNRAAMLERTLGGALRQRDVELEVLVVDDSTDDQTERLVAGLGDARVQHVPGRARGVSDARNHGTAGASGEWIAYLDDDDLWAPDKLRAQVDLARRRGAAFAWSAAIPVDGALQPVQATIPAPDAEGLSERLVVGNPVPAGCSNVIASTEAVRSVEGFDSRLAQVADWDMWLQLAAVGPAACAGEVHVAYLQHAENMLLTDDSDPFPEFELLREKHAGLADRLGVSFSRAHYARWAATRHRRAGERRRAASMLLRESRDLRHGPANVARAAAVLVGEPVLEFARRRSGGRVPERPDWLDDYLADAN